MRPVCITRKKLIKKVSFLIILGFILFIPVTMLLTIKPVQAQIVNTSPSCRDKLSYNNSPYPSDNSFDLSLHYPYD